MTYTEIILAAMYQADGREGRGKFSIEDIAVIAWRNNRKEFGLKGYEELYPDSKKVQVSFYKYGFSSPFREWLVKVQKNPVRWKLTESGIAEAQRILGIKE